MPIQARACCKVLTNCVNILFTRLFALLRGPHCSGFYASFVLDTPSRGTCLIISCCLPLPIPLSLSLSPLGPHSNSLVCKFYSLLLIQLANNYNSLFFCNSFLLFCDLSLVTCLSFFTRWTSASAFFPFFLSLAFFMLPYNPKVSYYFFDILFPSLMTYFTGYI